MKPIGIWFRSFSRFGQIGVVVLAAHAAVILILFLNHAATRSAAVRKPIAIRTTVYSRPAVSSEKAAQATPNIKPPLKETKKNLPVRSNPKEKSVGKENHPASPIDPNLLHQIADSLGALGGGAKISKPSHFAVPHSIEIKKGTQGSFDRPGYGETVSAILQSSLDLPEFGQVVAKIEIDACGAVTQCDILDTKSRKNAEFLKKRLRELVFPCFNEFGLSENRLNFTITFHNVENR